MPRIFSLTLRLIAFLTLAMAGVIRAGDVYDHSGTNGSFTDGLWLNQTQSTPGNQIHGNPGAADDAYFYGSTITASGSSVHLLSGGSLSLSGNLTAVNVGELNSLSGSGTLNIQAIVLDAAGFTGMTVVGGHLIAQNGDGVSNVTAGGTVVDQTCSGSNGCGSFDGGSSLTITGAGGPGERAIFSNASTFTANAGLTSFTLQLASGSKAQVSTMTDALIRIDGAGSILTASGDCSLNSQSMNISHGGAATLNGNLTQSTVGPIHVNDSGTSLTIGGKFSMTGGGLQINSGGTVRAGSLTQTRGSDSFDGSNSALTVDQELTLNAAFFDISGGAAVTVNGQFVLDGGKDVDGNDIGGGGHWQGMGTMIASNGAMFIGDHSSGGFSLSVNNSATVQTGEVEIGSNASSVGQVGLSGAGTLWEVRTGGLGVGQGGSGTFNISSSGRLLFDSGTLFGVGLEAGSTGRMTIDGSGSSVDATSALLSVGVEAGGTGNIVLTDQASLSLGQNTFIGDGGSGSLSIGSGCHVTLTGNANTNFGVANQPGSTGGVSVQDGGNLNVDALFIVGVGGNGFVGVGNGGMVQSIAVSLGGNSSALGTVVVDGAGSIWNSSGNVFIGYANEGSGKWTVSSGGALNIVGSAPKFGLGELTGTTGELDVDGSGSQVTASRFISGVLGTGTTNVTNGGLLQTGSAVIGAARSSIGHVLVTDAGSQWTVTTNGIYIAGLVTSGGFSQGGPGTLTVGTGGLVLVPRVIGIGRLGNIILNGGAVGIGTNANPAANTLRVAADGILTGSGRVQGQVIVAQGGRVLPGNSPGILTIDGDYEQDAGATYSVEIGGPDPASGYDQINATGTATLGGNLNVRLTDGFTPQVGQTFRIISASSVSGAFSSISGPSQAGINLTSDSSGVTATITSVVDGAPVISGATTAGAAPGTPFSYQITATNSPTSFGATDLPDGLTVDNATGIISGTPTSTGTFIVPINANNAAGSGQAECGDRQRARLRRCRAPACKSAQHLHPAQCPDR